MKKIIISTSIIVFLLPLLLQATPHKIVSKNVSNKHFEQQFKKIEQQILSSFDDKDYKKRNHKKANLFQRAKLALLKKIVKKQLKQMKRRIDTYKSADCDLIILATGEEIEAKVTAIKPDVIEYKKCSHLDGPTITKSKSQIFMIKYANGEKEMMESVRSKNGNSNKNQFVESYEKAGAWPFIFGILMGLLLPFLGWLFMYMFKKNSLKRRFFFFGWSLGFLIVSLLLLLAAS